MKGDTYDPKMKPKKLSKKEREKMLKQRERMFAWVPDKMKGERAKHDKVVVIKNLFDPQEFNTGTHMVHGQIGFTVNFEACILVLTGAS